MKFSKNGHCVYLAMEKNKSQVGYRGMPVPHLGCPCLLCQTGLGQIGQTTIEVSSNSVLFFLRFGLLLFVCACAHLPAQVLGVPSDRGCVIS